MPDVIMDIFRGDAFSSVTLTGLINANVPFAPSLLRDMGIAPAEGVYTTRIAFEEFSGTLRMLSSVPRGGPPSQQAHPRGKIREVRAFHFPRQVTVNADELLEVRARGGLNPQTLQNLLTERVTGPLGVYQEWALTLEHMLLGLVQGIVLDGDNLTELYNFYTDFGISAPSPVNIAFSTMTADTTAQIAAGMSLKRQMINALNGMPIGAGQIVVLCGSNFYDALITSAEYRVWQKAAATGVPDAATILSKGTPYSAVYYNDILWIEYRGTADSLVSIPTNEGRAFMRGVPGLFQTYYAPADTFDTVTAKGLPQYLLNDPHKQGNDKRAVFEFQSNPIFLCTRPQSLFRITKS